MKKFTISMAFMLLFLLPASLRAQQDSSAVDSLDIVTVTGTVMVFESPGQNMIFLDVDADSTADYKLNFGPPWYEPEESEAVRPADGDEVTIAGGLFMEDDDEIQMIIVYEINGEFWRDPEMEDDNGPDSLEVVTVTGTVMVSVDTARNQIFLDVDADSVADYKLNFGPPWYEPYESEAVRPSNGDVVTITGGLAYEDDEEEYQVIIVYEIDGELWRDPDQPFWNNPGGMQHKGGKKGKNNKWQKGLRYDSLSLESVTGTVLVDTNYFNIHHTLDVDGDELPDYFLNFGPPWYVPESGIERPAAGDDVEVYGAVVEGEVLSVIIVFELNGEVWRDTSSIGQHLNGGWVHKEMNQALRVGSPFDRADWVEFPADWNNKGGQGHNKGDLFCQLLEIDPDDVPAPVDGAVAAYEFILVDQDGRNQMKQSNGKGKKMDTASKVRFQLHVNDEQLGERSGKRLQVKLHDPDSDGWIDVEASALNMEAGTVQFETAELSDYILVTAEDDITSVEQDVAAPKAYVLEQNYPNPFNPSTTIEFTLAENSEVTLKVYNILGQQVATLVNSTLPAGVHSVQFDASALAAGMYLYQIQAADFRSTRKMILLK